MQLWSRKDKCKVRKGSTLILVASGVAVLATAWQSLLVGKVCADAGEGSIDCAIANLAGTANSAVIWALWLFVILAVIAYKIVRRWLP